MIILHYANLKSSVICLFSRGTYFSFGIFISYLSVFEYNSFEGLLILSAILLPTKSPVASAVFSITLFEVDFIASAVDFFWHD